MTIQIKCTIGLLLLIALTACVPWEIPRSQSLYVLTDDTTITLERICAWFSHCPVYTLSIHGDGNVIFSGGQHTIGKASTVITKEQVKELLNAFDQAKFLSLGNYECSTLWSGPCPTDAPLTIITISINGMTKSVRHYSPDKTTPEKLIYLECKIDQIVGSQEKWIRVRIPGCPLVTPVFDGY
jgi:hypothetical protein